MRFFFATKKFSVLAVAFFCSAGALFAQDDGNASAIKVTTVLHEDGTKTITRVNREERTSEATTLDAGDKMMQRIVYSLDDRGQPQTAVVYAANGQPVMRAAYKHDTYGRTTEEGNYTVEGKLVRRIVFEFGANGSVSGMRVFDANGNELPTDSNQSKSTARQQPAKR